MTERAKTAEDQALAPLFGNLDPQGPFRIFADGEQIFPGVLTVTSRFGTLKVGKRPEGFATVGCSASPMGAVRLPFRGRACPTGKFLLG